MNTDKADRVFSIFIKKGIFFYLIVLDSKIAKILLIK